SVVHRNSWWDCYALTALASSGSTTSRNHHHNTEEGWRMKAMYLEMLRREVKLQSGLLVAVLIGGLGLAQSLRAAEFTCGWRNVRCLIDAINQANTNGQANRITLRRGTYTLTTVDNGTSGDANGLPVITSNLTITGQAAENTIIERDSSAP